ncbi:MAG: hypothetical protein PHH60_02645 [Candidatus Margulisbacteria bacterium]|nr:hypothetical protein [Candidatus Margulisiibacteriota bacterium]
MYLTVSGLICLLFGLFIIFTPGLLHRLSQAGNTIVLYLDDRLSQAKIWVGLLLVFIGVWLIYLVSFYPELWYITPVWLLCLLTGFFYLFLPNWLFWLSNLFDKLVFSADELIMGSRKVFGVILLVVSIYLFFSAYLINRR